MGFENTIICFGSTVLEVCEIFKKSA